MIRRVYHYLRTDEVTCDLDCKHRAAVHRVRFLEEVGTAQKWIIGLNYDTDGYGQVRIAVDDENRVYRSDPGWDGYQGWVRDDDQEGDEVYFDRPIMYGDVTCDEDGTRINTMSLWNRKRRAKMKA